MCHGNLSTLEIQAIVHACCLLDMSVYPTVVFSSSHNKFRSLAAIKTCPLHSPSIASQIWLFTLGQKSHEQPHSWFVHLFQKHRKEALLSCSIRALWVAPSKPCSKLPFSSSRQPSLLNQLTLILNLPKSFVLVGPPCAECHQVTMYYVCTEEDYDSSRAGPLMTRYSSKCQASPSNGRL